MNKVELELEPIILKMIKSKVDNWDKETQRSFAMTARGHRKRGASLLIASTFAYLDIESIAND